MQLYVKLSGAFVRYIIFFDVALIHAFYLIEKLRHKEHKRIIFSQRDIYRDESELRVVNQFAEKILR